MGAETYRIVFKGEILPARETAEVKKSIAGLFKLKAEQVEKLFIGKPVSVKRGLSPEAAVKFQKAFERTGAKVYIVSEGSVKASPTEESSAAPSQKPERSESKPHPVSSTMTCPKCGHVQPRSDECINCGVVISKLDNQNKTTLQAPSEKQADEEDIVLFVDRGIGREERLLHEGIKLWDKPSETMKKLEAQLDKPDRWFSHIKLAGMLIIGNKADELRRAKEILELVNKNTNSGRPETFDLLATMYSLSGNKKEMREAARRSIKLYQLDYPNQKTKKDRKVFEKNVERLRKDAEMERTFSVVNDSGKVIFETTDMKELKHMRRDKKLPKDSRIIENGLGDGVPLQMWRRPDILGISFDDRPVTSLAKLIAIVPGLIGIFLMWDQCMELYESTFDIHTNDDVQMFIFFALVPVAFLLFRRWKWAFYSIAAIMFFFVGPGFVVGASVGFVPSLLVAWIAWPFMKKRLEPEDVDPRRLATV